MESTHDFHPQDWILVVEALIEWAEHYERESIPKTERAWKLVRTISKEQGLPPVELIEQGDTDWPDRY